MYNVRNVCRSRESSSSNYIRGHYTIGREIQDDILDSIRKETERCDFLEGFHIHGSLVGGSCGSMSRLCERLSVDYGKTPKLNFVEWPSPSTSNITVEYYNAVLAIHDLQEHASYNVYWQNEKLHEIFYKKLGVYSSNYDNINY